MIVFLNLHQQIEQLCHWRLKTPFCFFKREEHFFRVVFQQGQQSVQVIAADQQFFITRLAFFAQLFQLTGLLSERQGFCVVADQRKAPKSVFRIFPVGFCCFVISLCCEIEVTQSRDTAERVDCGGLFKAFDGFFAV